MDSDVLVQEVPPVGGDLSGDGGGQSLEKRSGFGALAGGLLASSCCILPLALVSFGIGGAWLSNLTALSPYQPVFLTLAAASIGYGFWKSRLARKAACATDGTCAMPINSRLNTVLLWIGGGLAIAAFGITLAAPLFY